MLDTFGLCERASEERQFELEEILDLGRGIVLAVARQDAPVASIAPGAATDGRRMSSQCAGSVTALVTTYCDIYQGRAVAERLAESRR